MTNNEEIERKMNFIVEQQAQFASDIQRLQESQARTEQVVAQTAESVDRMSGAVSQTAETVGQIGEVVTRLANATHAGFTEVNAKLNVLVDAQIPTEENLVRTNQNLTDFIAVVDRRFGDGRNSRYA
jgi:hypothetical protein